MSAVARPARPRPARFPTTRAVVERDGVRPTGDPEPAAQAAPRVGRLEAPDAVDAPIQVVPVRRDGSGRLVAVGLLRATDPGGAERWTTVGGRAHPGETIEQTIHRCLGETLGSEVRAQRSPAPRLGAPGRADAAPSVEPGERAPTYAVEMRGRLVPQGTALRLAWFLVTALPPRGEVSSAQWTLLADFLEAQGEPAVAARTNSPFRRPSGWAVSGLKEAAPA